MAWTWTELLDDIKVRGMIPTSQNTFTEARLLSLTNAELRSRVLPLVDKVREGFYSYDIDTTLNATGIYNINKRAVGGKILNAALIEGDQRYDLTYYTEESLENYDAPLGDFGLYIKRSTQYLVPRVPQGWSTFRSTIMLRPAQIVAQTSAAQISSIDTVTGIITCSSVPSAWTTASVFDIVQAEPHFDTLSIDLAISAVTTGTSGTLTFTPANLNSRLAVGDWIGLAGETPVIQVPVELNPLLAQYVANICLKSQTDMTAYKIGVEDAKELKEGLLHLLTPRVQSEGKKIVNRTGILRRGL